MSILRLGKRRKPGGMAVSVVRLALGTRRGRVTVAAAVVAAVIASRWPSVVQGVGSLARLLLELGGLVWPLALVWAVALLLAFRFYPRRVVRRAHMWLGALIALGVVAGIASLFPIPSGPLAGLNPGGAAGSALAGPNIPWAVVRLLALALVGVWALFPRASSRATLRTSRGIGRVSRATARGIRATVRGIRAVFRWLPLHRYAWVTLRALVLGTAWLVVAPSRALKRLRRRHVPTPAPLGVSATPIDTPSLPEPDDETEQEDTAHGPAFERIEDEAEEEDEEWEVVEVEAEEDEDGPAVVYEEVEPKPPTSPVARRGEGAATARSLGQWRLPPLSLLRPGGEVPPDEEAQQQQARLIEQTLADYGVEAKVTQIKPGPTVTMFGLTPGWIRRRRQVVQRDEQGNPVVDARGRPVTRSVEERKRVKVDSIIAREKDLALALAIPSLRIEAPVPGESVVGLEVPNANPSLVTLRSIMESEEFQRLSKKTSLALALGKGPGGAPVVADLAKMPHLLVAGATGSGKSVFLNSVIACLLSQCTPLQVRLLLVDPKRVELTPYNGLPHLLKPVVVEPEEVVRYLHGLRREMDRRYRRLEEVGARNIEGFNAIVGQAEQMPYVVVCIDELADLMLAAPGDVERSICRLAQMGRATGIHLVVATQRPSVDVITGLIKANFPSRISFNVVSQVDSRTILDTVGAERLLGRGDMLYLPPDAAKPMRAQSTFVSDEEIEDLMEYWTTHTGPPVPEIDLEEPPPEDGNGVGDGHDELFIRALKLARGQRQLSTSFLQRRLRVGYPRAARLREDLEHEGVLGPGGEVNAIHVDALLSSLGEE